MRGLMCVSMSGHRKSARGHLRQSIRVSLTGALPSAADAPLRRGERAKSAASGIRKLGRPAILETASARGVKLFTPLICNLC